MRCANVRNGHAAKGHQLSDGRVFARGSYESSFSFQTNRKQILDDIYMWYSTFMDKIAQLNHHGHDRMDVAVAIHRDDVLASHYPPAENDEPVGLRHTTFCICCLFQPTEALLPCGHMLCTECIRSFGQQKSQTLVEVLECPLEASHSTHSEPRSIYLMPEAAGVRVLALHNGGIRSIIQIEILKLIEKELHGKIPIQSFFDMVIGEGTGGVIGLGLIAQGWKLNDCERNLGGLFEKVFVPSNVQKFPGLMKSSHSKYRSRMLDEILSSLFTSDQRIIDLCNTKHPVDQSAKVAVLTSSATGRKVLFSNYRRKAASKLPYTLYPATDYATEPKTWEIARASMAHPDLFKAFTDARLGSLFFKKDMSENFLIEVAQNECRAIYSSAHRDFPDVLLTLGCGRSKRPPLPSIASDDTRQTQNSRWTKISKRSKSLADENKSSYSEDSGDAYAHYPRPNFISLNPVLEELPDLDDVSSIPGLQQLIRENTDPEVITRLVSQLFATLFYAEIDDPVHDSPAGEVLVPGMCRPHH